MNAAPDIDERKRATDQVTIFTDGACIGNPGPGGWACVFRFETKVGEMFGSAPDSTNNRMELQAVIEGLRALQEPSLATIHTDSQYVQRGTTEWLPSWKASGWRKRSRRPVLNQDLWMELDRLLVLRRAEWRWVRGHAKDADNIRCDFLANRAAREQITSNGVTWL